MPTEPIAKGDREHFDFIKERILAELRGELGPEDVLMQLDSIVRVPAAPADTIPAKDQTEAEKK